MSLSCKFDRQTMRDTVLITDRAVQVDEAV